VAGLIVNNVQLSTMAGYGPYYTYYHKKYRKYYAQ